MIYFYGNAMCLNYATTEFDRFRRLGLNVLIPDYVGYGMSGGTPSERGCQATADAAYDFLVSRRRVDPQQIIAAGWSLGGAVAIDLAARRTVGGLIAFSTFTSTNDMARTIFPIKLPGWFFVHRFESLYRSPRSRARYYWATGVATHWFHSPCSSGWRPRPRLRDNARHRRAGHNDFYDEGGRRIDDAIAAFVADHF